MNLMILQKYFHNIMTDKVSGGSAEAVKAVFGVLSFFYGLLTQFVYWCHQKNILTAYMLKQPVVSIGNITVGGVGKTPLVEYVVKFLKNERIRSTVLIRGYMGELKRDSFLTEESDEAELLKQNLPGVSILVGRNRLRNALSVPEEEKLDVFILDDGFQHWSLNRNLDIVVIDAVNPFGNNYVLPRGILREPLNALQRADLFVLTKTNIGEENVPYLRMQLKKINPLAPIVETIHQPFAAYDLRKPAQESDLFPFAGREACVFCSIGDPASFLKTLRAYSIKSLKTFEFMDHHRYSREDMENIAQFCRESNIETVMTTQKDAVKVMDYLDVFDFKVNIICVKIAIKVTRGEKELHAKLRAAVRK
mgnify:CR=1 FL=1